MPPVPSGCVGDRRCGGLTLSCKKHRGPAHPGLTRVQLSFVARGLLEQQCSDYGAHALGVQRRSRGMRAEEF